MLGYWSDSWMKSGRGVCQRQRNECQVHEYCSTNTWMIRDVGATEVLLCTLNRQICRIFCEKRVVVNLPNASVPCNINLSLGGD